MNKQRIFGLCWTIALSVIVWFVFTDFGRFLLPLFLVVGAGFFLYSGTSSRRRAKDAGVSLPWWIRWWDIGGALGCVSAAGGILLVFLAIDPALGLEIAILGGVFVLCSVILFRYVMVSKVRDQ